LIEDGSGLAVCKAVVQLRLHFSYITEAVQNNVAKAGQALAASATAKQLQQFQTATANTGSDAAMVCVDSVNSMILSCLMVHTNIMYYDDLGAAEGPQVLHGQTAAC
jgi:hypothetical protein